MPTDPVEARRRDARLYARTPTHRQRLDHARAIVRAALQAAPSWYVAVSGGKDSTCVLHLVHEQAPRVVASNSTYEWMFPETDEYLRRIPALRRVATPTDHGTKWAPNWRTQEDAERAYPGIVWLEPRVGEDVGHSEAGVFLGLRADEAPYRRRHLRRMGPLFHCRQSDRWHCSPIAWWTVDDVWAYIETEQLDYNRAYDRLVAIGIDRDKQRIGPLVIAPDVLRRGWPALWARYARVHPLARRYA